MVFREFELQVVSLLVPKEVLARELIETAELVSVEHTGNGYFLTVKHASFPEVRRTFHEPLAVGSAGTLEVGFVVYVGDCELTLECHALGTPVPRDMREAEVVVRTGSERT